jgi:hypothetical protein
LETFGGISQQTVSLEAERLGSADVKEVEEAT